MILTHWGLITDRQTQLIKTSYELVLSTTFSLYIISSRAAWCVNSRNTADSSLSDAISRPELLVSPVVSSLSVRRSQQVEHDTGHCKTGSAALCVRQLKHSSDAFTDSVVKFNHSLGISGNSDCCSVWISGSALTEVRGCRKEAQRKRTRSETKLSFILSSSKSAAKKSETISSPDTSPLFNQLYL